MDNEFDARVSILTTKYWGASTHRINEEAKRQMHAWQNMPRTMNACSVWLHHDEGIE